MDYDSRYVVQLEQDNLFSLNSSFTLFAAKEKSGVNIFSIGTGFNVTTTILNIWMIHQYPYPLGVGEDKIVKKLTSYNIPLYMTYTFIGERNGCFSTKIGAYIPVNNEKALNLPLKAESKSAVSPFFNLGFGFKIKRFIPFLSVEAIYYRSKVQGDYWSVGNSLFLRTQLGLAFVL